MIYVFLFFFSSRRRHTRCGRDWSSDVCSSDLLDIALGIGGLPFGRVVEIYGPESSGKTTLTLSVIAQAQKMGKTCAFIDAERSEERRVGKECRSRWWAEHRKTKESIE